MLQETFFVGNVVTYKTGILTFCLEIDGFRDNEEGKLKQSSYHVYHFPDFTNFQCHCVGIIDLLVGYN